MSKNLHNRLFNILKDAWPVSTLPQGPFTVKVIDYVYLSFNYLKQAGVVQ